MGGIFPKYKLTDKQIRGIACIVAHEQPGLVGMMAEASQIANRTDIKGDSYATAENIVKTVTSGWYAKGKSRYEKGTSNETAIKAVKLCIVEGFRILPRYIDEHDCMSDISTAKNGTTNVKNNKAKWKPYTTVIKNKMGSKYTFYDFPGGYKTGVDPFGYTSKSYRKKWGDFCYTPKQAQDKVEFTPAYLLSHLYKYHTFIKEHHKYFINKYDSSMTTFAKAKANVDAKKKVGLTCVVGLRWALADMGLKNSSGKSLISGQNGTFKSYFTGDFTKHLTRISKGAVIGLTVKEAINKNLLKPGDIICYHKHTHTSVYSGDGYYFYEGGSQSANSGYANGIKINYEKYPFKISEILRWKNQGKSTTTSNKLANETMTTKKLYTDPLPELPSRGYYQLNDGIKTLINKKDQIKRLQKAINWGLDGVPGHKALIVDGQIGNATVGEIKLFQKTYGLVVDGKFGQKTLSKLKTIKK